MRINTLYQIKNINNQKNKHTPILLNFIISNFNYISFHNKIKMNDFC